MLGWHDNLDQFLENDELWGERDEKRANVDLESRIEGRTEINKIANLTLH